MPTVNIYIDKEELVSSVAEVLGELRAYVAETLSCSDRKLAPNEVSTRLLVPRVALPISAIEVEINAYAYPERIAEQDDICRKIAAWFVEKANVSVKPHVWLVLSELGHSWEE